MCDLRTNPTKKREKQGTAVSVACGGERAVTQLGQENYQSTM